MKRLDDVYGSKHMDGMGCCKTRNSCGHVCRMQSKRPNAKNYRHFVSLTVLLSDTKLVKPSNSQTARQSSTFAWRMSYAPTAILNTEKKASAIPEAFRF
jgi:hypothetical protein